SRSGSAIPSSGVGPPQRSLLRQARWAESSSAASRRAASAGPPITSWRRSSQAAWRVSTSASWAARRAQPGRPRESRASPAADAGDQRHAPRRDRRLQREEVLQRLGMELGLAVRQEADLVDRNRPPAIVLPVVGVALERVFREEGFRQPPRDFGLPEVGFAREEVGLGKVVALKLRLEQPERSRVPRDALESRGFGETHGDLEGIGILCR